MPIINCLTLQFSTRHFRKIIRKNNTEFSWLFLFGVKKMRGPMQKHNLSHSPKCKIVDPSSIVSNVNAMFPKDVKLSVNEL